MDVVKQELKEEQEDELVESTTNDFDDIDLEGFYKALICGH